MEIKPNLTNNIIAERKIDEKNTINLHTIRLS